MIANVRKITSSLSFLHFRPENQVLNNGLNDDTDTDCRIRLCFAIVRYVLRLLQRQLIPKLVQKIIANLGVSIIIFPIIIHLQIIAFSICCSLIALSLSSATNSKCARDLVNCSFGL
eukprot:139487_1